MLFSAKRQCGRKQASKHTHSLQHTHSLTAAQHAHTQKHKNTLLLQPPNLASARLLQLLQHCTTGSTTGAGAAVMLLLQLRLLLRLVLRLWHDAGLHIPDLLCVL